MTEHRQGILAIVAACVIWGLSPLFYKLLNHVPATELFLHRSVWSFVIFTALLAVQGRLGALKAAFGTRRAAGITVFAAAMVATNWFLFIWAVHVGRTTETALGYYILPLVAVLLGVTFLNERLGRVQWAAIALATLGVLVLAVGLQTTPWLSLVLAVTFALYGLVKKGLATGPVVSVTAESMILAPVSISALIWWHLQGNGSFGKDLWTSLLLVFSGVLTALPLVLFSRGAQRVPLATLGLVQYLNPTLQFLCAVLVFAEPFTSVHAVTFGLIWAALALYSGSALVQDRARRRIAATSSVEPPLWTKSSKDASAKP